MIGRMILTFFLVMLAAGVASTNAQEVASNSSSNQAATPQQIQYAAKESDLVAGGWSFLVAPYVWFVSVEGSMTLRGQTADVDASFGDIWDNLNFGGFLFAEAKNGPVTIYTDTVYADLEADNAVGPLSVNADIDLLIFNFGLRYEAAKIRLSERTAEHRVDLLIEPIFGGRLYNVEGDFGFSRLPSVSESKTWVDPLFGLKLSSDITPRLNVFTMGDLGGFGVSSDFTWQAVGAVGYRFGLFGEADANVVAGYRAIYDDYETGNGSNRFAVDATFHGPILGLQVVF